ncbi:WcbI family polysaccharide biosynthesis putative acetyltransferase [Herbiconiux sp. A18JL235]|uniref:WcbI family polysaccharide biosynthesis putative acetyltransferase n=1 Tax=Herbiconiux sp. A18JL235 TaxID=3152363 RepID=A0AB39BJ39_9MICO
MPDLSLATAPPHLRPFHSSPEQAAGGGERVVLTIGNCQAESLRVVLPQDAGLLTVRTPPVHELTETDARQLHAWIARADLVALQPVRDDYRGLPVGTRQLLQANAGRARVAVVPIIRYAGLYPRQLIVRPPSDTSLTPPLVPYHDAGVLLEAAGHRLPPLTPAAVHAVARASLDELRAREAAHGTVRASDLFDAPSFGLMRTINHPGNPVWAALASRVLEAWGVTAAPHDPGRPLLDSVHAPREQAVIDAFGLEADARPDWTVDGETVGFERMRRAHLDWYAEHPDAVAAGLARHEATLRALAGA